MQYFVFIAEIMWFLTSRVDAEMFSFYKKADLESMAELTEIKQEFLERVKSIANKANEYKDSFDQHSYLWLDDRKESMRQFLLYNHVLTQEEVLNYSDISAVPESAPTLEHFKQKVIRMRVSFLKLISFLENPLS